MDSKFEVELLEEAFKFIKKQDLKVRKKIFQNINRSRFVNDPKLLKKLNKNIWEFRTTYLGIQFRLLAFWDKRNESQKLVIATHGFKKKTDKIAKKEIDKAEKIRQKYLEN
jgi:phage-related protein